MPHFESTAVMYLWIAVLAALAIALLLFGYRIGNWAGCRAGRKTLADKEQELFAAQRGFRNVYEQEAEKLRQEAAAANERATRLEAKVEEYRKKAAGYGGLFSQNNKRADAMYALLLENESLEEALLQQNEKLSQERADSVREQLRSTGYRRALISQLLNDERIKSYVAEVLADDKRLPTASAPNQTALPDHSTPPNNGH